MSEEISLLWFFQDPNNSFNPIVSVGKQLYEILQIHADLRKEEIKQKCLDLMEMVALKDPENMFDKYPHEISGGEKQRILLSMALACNPKCIIFDEPTTALDVINADNLLKLFLDLQKKTKVSALYISHDLAVVSQIADKIAVICKGEIVEFGEAKQILKNPQHEYTKKLIAAVPNPKNRLKSPNPTLEKPFIELENISVSFHKRSWFGKIIHTFIGNKNISLNIKPKETFGIVGESGSGKSTLAKSLVSLNEFTGMITLDSREYQQAKDFDDDYRSKVQIIFQHPGFIFRSPAKSRKNYCTPFVFISQNFKPFATSTKSISTFGYGEFREDV